MKIKKIKLNLWFLILCLGLLTFSRLTEARERKTFSDLEQIYLQEDPKVLIRPAKSYKLKKFFLFPFELPAYVIRGVSYPIVKLTKWAERHQIMGRAISFFQVNKNLFIFPILEAGFGNGFGGGFGLRANDVFHQGYSFSLDYQIYEDLDQKASAILTGPRVLYLGDHPITFKIESNFLRQSDSQFRGVGAASKENNDGEFSQLRFDVGGIWDFGILSSLKLSSSLSFFWINTDEVEGNDNLLHLFPQDDLPGFGEPFPYVVGGFSIIHDTRDFDLRPVSGGHRRLGFKRYQNLKSGQFSFNAIDLDIRQYIPLWIPRQSLALRMAWSWQLGGEPPFYLLNSLGLNTPLRSYNPNRFRDRHSLVFNLEYRYPIWDRLDAFIFLDTGRVFKDFEDLSFDHWQYSVGGGLYFRIGPSILLHAQGGYGGEGVKFSVRLGPTW